MNKNLGNIKLDFAPKTCENYKEDNDIDVDFDIEKWKKSNNISEEPF